MRKRNIKTFADTFMWYIVYTLPLLAYMLYMLAMPSTSTSVVDFATFMTSSGFALSSVNPVYTAIASVFGNGGIMPLFNDVGIVMYVAYFASCIIVHIAVDVLVFIPRIAHNYLDGFTKGVNNE